MTNEEKTKRIKTMLLAIRVLNRKITNLYYQASSFTDAAIFMILNDVDQLIDKQNELDGEYYAANQVIENEHK